MIGVEALLVGSGVIRLPDSEAIRHASAGNMFRKIKWSGAGLREIAPPRQLHHSIAFR